MEQTQTFFIGGISLPSSLSFRGYIDEYALINETLNASEIARLYSGVTYPYSMQHHQ